MKLETKKIILVIFPIFLMSNICFSQVVKDTVINEISFDSLKSKIGSIYNKCCGTIYNKNFDGGIINGISSSFIFPYFPNREKFGSGIFCFRVDINDYEDRKRFFFFVYDSYTKFIRENDIENLTKETLNYFLFANLSQEKKQIFCF